MQKNNDEEEDDVLKDVVFAGLVFIFEIAIIIISVVYLLIKK